MVSEIHPKQLLRYLEWEQQKLIEDLEVCTEYTGHALSLEEIEERSEINGQLNLIERIINDFSLRKSKTASA